MSTSTTSDTETRALDLLGKGIPPQMVADAIGVDVSRISQLVSDPEFSYKVAELRYENLSKHNIRDNKYDDMEDVLLDKLTDMLVFMTKPMEVVRALTAINLAKRRGSSLPNSIQNTQQIVQLIMPTQILQQFTLNGNNQVIKAGNQDLITVQSGNMKKLLENRNEQSIQTDQRAIGLNQSNG